MTYQIERNVPMPSYYGRGRPVKYPLGEMDVGESFLVPGEDVSIKVRSTVSKWGIRHGRKFTTRSVEGGCAGVEGSIMSNDDLQQDALRLIRKFERIGYSRGLREGISRLEMLAGIVPGSVTKAWLIEQAGREAAALRRKIPETER